MASAALAVLLVAASLASLLQQTAADGLRGDVNKTTPAGLNLLSLASSAGGCSAADGAQMSKLGSGNADGTFPKYLAVCGKQSYNIFFGFNSGKFLSCVERDTGISSSCAQCFVSSAKYGADNCKWSCFFGSWCGSSCLNCVASANQETAACAGVPVPSAATCR
ncbi:hypothetical protein AK812_SmicGene5840 [Symbiodinium microadriaticum]|uniref:Uncharacterized protein n=1 Tax=Symbiodinium microadriaticum TaxID=2951 RepID=A0A1Q9ESP8_SYMMI|nr:hypothetical protein AK812_SmicGene5840 [Symbiodinium microadriaticum]